MSWLNRIARLGALLNTQGNEEEDGIALDRLLHGQSVIGSTPRTKEVDSLRFSDGDLSVIGTLERGQYGTIHLVTCKLDGKVYVRKSIERKFALRTREQCSPVLERTILLRAFQSRTPWCPYLLCAFQSATHLNLVMDFAPGGSLQDLLESSPLEGRVSESDLRWWMPQIVSAIAWCHEQGFAHRDVKPNNLVLTESNHIQLIDFGSAAPLLPADETGRRMIAREHCLVPCGTCDYISPEILVAHERALVRLEMDLSRSDDGADPRNLLDDEDDENQPDGYGAETDWWSAGAMMYEMTYGVTPFFADSIKTTYLRIMDYETSLRFDKSTTVSEPLKDLIRCFLTDASRRLGRQGEMDIKNHPFFADVDWKRLAQTPAPANLHVPQFAAVDVPGPDQTAPIEEDSSLNQGWSAVFQSSPLAHAQSYGLGSMIQNTPKIKSILRTPSALRQSHATNDVSMGLSAFIGFSWGPRKDITLVPDAPGANLSADASAMSPQFAAHNVQSTPRQFPRVAPVLATPLGPRMPTIFGSVRQQQRLVTPMRPGQQAYMTPARPLVATPGGAVASSATAGRRGVSEREAMRQLIDCVGMSARKTVLASGRKPRLLNTELFRPPAGADERTSRAPDLARARNRSRSVSISTIEFTENLTQSVPRARGQSGGSSVRKELRFADVPAVLGGDASGGGIADASAATSRNSLGYVDARPLESDTETETEAETASAPPSPSPSPRPGSAMSLSRRSMTPTASLPMFGAQNTLSTRPSTVLGLIDDRALRFRSSSPVTRPDDNRGMERRTLAPPVRSSSPPRKVGAQRRGETAEGARSRSNGSEPAAGPSRRSSSPRDRGNERRNREVEAIQLAPRPLRRSGSPPARQDGRGGKVPPRQSSPPAVQNDEAQKTKHEVPLHRTDHVEDPPQLSARPSQEPSQRAPKLRPSQQEEHRRSTEHSQPIRPSVTIQIFKPDESDSREAKDYRASEGRPTRRRVRSSWDDMEKRHAQLMRDLDSIQRRLDSVQCS